MRFHSSGVQFGHVLRVRDWHTLLLSYGSKFNQMYNCPVFVSTGWDKYIQEREDNEFDAYAVSIVYISVYS